VLKPEDWKAFAEGIATFLAFIDPAKRILKIGWTPLLFALRSGPRREPTFISSRERGTVPSCSRSTRRRRSPNFQLQPRPLRCSS
jgi:hypothetical protein